MNFYIKKIERKTGKHLALYMIPIEIDGKHEKGWCRQVRSYDAFSRNQYNQHPLYAFVCKNEFDHQMDAKLSKRCYEGMGMQEPIIPENRSFDTIWEFYEAIGWDRKKQRFTGAI